MSKRCPMCEQERPLDAFYRRRDGKGANVYCKPCAIQQTVVRQRLLKSQALAHKGGRCQRCGYDRCESALEFHHRDPNEKEFSLSRAGTTTFDKVREELEKCDLLCANCHREAHAQTAEGLTVSEATPIGNGVKTCPSCRRHLPLDAFYDRRNQRGASSFCRRCSKLNALERQRRSKQQAVAYKGSRCQRCGYRRHIGSLEFHHRDPSQKDFMVSRKKMTPIALLKGELDKCDLLCVNCHREVHASMAVL